MGVMGTVSRMAVLAGTALSFAPASASATLVSPTFGWISTGVTMGAGNVLTEDAHGSIAVTTNEGLEHLYTLGRVRRSGGVQPLLTGPGLVPGPDGALWEARKSTANWNVNEVVRISPQGVMQALSFDGALGGMAAGPDGAVWVAAEEGFEHVASCAGAGPQSAACEPSIVKLTPDAAPLFFPLPSSMHQMRWMAAGADGDLWFGAAVGHGLSNGPAPTNGIVRMSSTGKIRYWALGSGRDEEAVRGAASGSGGVWFTFGPQEIGRISYAGHVSLFSKGIPKGAYPDAITRGPDGAMWFTQLQANAIGRIDRKGHVTEAPWGKLIISEATGAQQIVSAPHRTLLFYRPGREEFGRLSIDGRCVAPSLVGYDFEKVAPMLRRAGCHLAVRDRHRGPAKAVVSAQSVRPGTVLAHRASIEVRTVSPRLAAKRCIPSPAQRKVLGDSQFVLLGEVLEDEAIYWRARYLACAYGQDGPHMTKPALEVWFGEWGGGGSAVTVQPLVAAGRYLAWQRSASPGYGNETSRSITVLDVPEDKVIAEQQFPSYTPISGSEVQATDLALDPDGHVAWRARISTFGASPRVAEAVEAIGEGGQMVVLESGESGSFGPLSFEPAGTLRWSNNGAARTYMFPVT